MRRLDASNRTLAPTRFEQGSLPMQGGTWIMDLQLRDNRLDWSQVYPPPRIPILPVLSWQAMGRSAEAPLPSVLDAGNAVDVANGTAAIALALRHAGVSRGDKVLIPAYNCPSMVEPVLAVSAQPSFYRLHRNASFDVDDIERQIGPTTRALLVPHFFGFPQDTVAARHVCDRHGLVLIEDCAHMFFGTIAEHPVGWHGDYAIASTRKFFPIYDGGYLISSRRSLDDLATRSGGSLFDLKATVNILEESNSYRRLRALGYPLAVPRYLRDVLKRRSVARAGHIDGERDAGAPGSYEYIDPTTLERRTSLPSRLLTRLSRLSRVIDRRRVNYRTVVDGLSDLRGGRPLFAAAPAVPYMFPLLVDDPHKVSTELKRRGLPIWRWEESQTAGCEHSQYLARHLFQLPCHQELETHELEWLIATVREIVDGG